jgi:DNA polymerase II small subunit
MPGCSHRDGEMEAQKIIESLRQKNYLVSPEALKAILESENPEELISLALENAKESLTIDLDDLKLRGKAKMAEEKVEVRVESTKFKSLAKDIESRVRPHRNSDNTTTGTLDDFVGYFRSRYDQLSGILKGREGNSLANMADLSKKSGEKVRIIGMVSDKRRTKNGHILLIMEDLTGTATVLIPASNRDLIDFGGSIVLDEVISINGRMSKELFIADSILQPEIPIKDVKTIEEDILLATLSDFHIGSKLFMQKNFENFIAWLNGDFGDDKARELASRVKYVTIAGDLVDGIGIYPGQEEELNITDIYEQYEAFSDYIQQIPEYVHVIISPGNHDAVKAADPQPAIPKELLPELHKLDNITLIPSPGTVDIHGLKTLVYHGTSLDDIIAAIPSLNYDHIEKVMVETLRRRHLHPIYGEKPITPETRDHLVINEIPDIFHVGHIHKNAYEKYRGVICINSGTWQEVTPYQIKLGHKPTPCILPLVSMNSGKINVIRFDRMI